ncbi:hypothetical protein [Actinokineospora diospyrosa]|uniref:EcsC family protein n=1 Tax=Actinokineospora diospyrosa TaxID=103728 RepID=A0ABT1INA1_9PSEU|nr:hypothetical protein [Actinokineospora diospyrosa]MCP2274142.1 hypothetical protein [Actinokineospora diospyrosa]
MATAEALGNAFLSAFEKLGIDPEMARRGVSEYATVESWINSQTAQAALVGGAASAVPGVHHAGVFVDAAVLIHKMAIMTWGIGYKVGAGVDGKLDLANTLALWSGAVDEDVLVVAGLAAVAVVGAAASGGGTAFAYAVAAKIAGKVAGAGAAAAATKLGAKGAAKGVGMIAGKLASTTMSHVAPHLGAKMAAKLATKHVTGWIPVVGAVTAGGINVWVMKRLADSATAYYRAKARYS